MSLLSPKGKSSDKIKMKKQGKKINIIISLYLIFLAVLISAETSTQTNTINYIDSCGLISSPGTYILTADIIDNDQGRCITITASDVIFDGNGHTIDGIDGHSSHGVTVFSKNVTVKNLISKDWERGIAYLETEGGIIFNNTLISNIGGIWPDAARNLEISNNHAINNDLGFNLFSSMNNVVLDNSVEYNGVGIMVNEGLDNTIKNNVAKNNGCGYYSEFSTRNLIINNTITNNSGCGLNINIEAYNNKIKDNIIKLNPIGVILNVQSSSNTLESNNISNNDLGIKIDKSDGNLIFNNYLSNLVNAEDNGKNFWDMSKTLGTNIIGGSYLGGNYWSDYTGDDLDGDGLGNTNLPQNKGILYGGDSLPLVDISNCKFINNKFVCLKKIDPNEPLIRITPTAINP